MAAPSNCMSASVNRLSWISSSKFLFSSRRRNSAPSEHFTFESSSSVGNALTILSLQIASINPGVSLWFRPSACTRVDHGHAAHHEAQPNVPLGNVDSEEAFDELALMNSHHFLRLSKLMFAFARVLANPPEATASPRTCTARHSRPAQLYRSFRCRFGGCRFVGCRFVGCRLTPKPRADWL